MADFTALKLAIQTYIKQNGNEEITGEKLQDILLSMVTTLGDSAINDLVTALNDEVAARQNADGTLQQNITNEATARGNADTALGGRIDDEATARANGDTALSNRLGSTITAENTVADQIGAEAEARAAADTALQELIDGITRNIENGYVYAGIATPSSTPATGKVFYLALTAGTYTNFGSTEVSQGINILKYNGSAWLLDAFIGIDDELTPGSNNLPKSGNVLENIIKNGSAFDLSAYNAVDGVLATYADLDAALTALNALPAVYKQGGMSVKFVHTSDNKYIQARCMADTFSTTESDWQVVDEEPIAGSKNLIESGGVYSINPELILSRYKSLEYYDGTLTGEGTIWSDAIYKYKVVPIKANAKLVIKRNQENSFVLQSYRIAVVSNYNFTTKELTLCDENSFYQSEDIDITTPSNAKYAIVNVVDNNSTQIIFDEFTVGNINILGLLSYKTEKGVSKVSAADGSSVNVPSEDSLFYVNQCSYGFGYIKEYAGLLDSSRVNYTLYLYARIKVIKLENSASSNHVRVVSGKNECRCVLLSEFIYGFTGSDQYYVLATGETGRRDGSFEVDTDAGYLIVQTIGYNQVDVTPDIISVNNKDVLNKNAVQVLYGDINRAEVKQGHLDSNKIYFDMYPDAKYIVIPVEGGKTLSIDGTIVKFMILKTLPPVPQSGETNFAVSFATGETARRNDAVNNLVLPNDARFVLIQTVNYQNVNCEISKLIVGDTDYFYNEKSFITKNYPSYIFGNIQIDGQGNTDLNAIPKYFSDEIKTTVNSCISLFTEPCLCFPLITDIHYMAKRGDPLSLVFQNLGDTSKILKHLSTILPFDFILNLGDNIDGRTDHYTMDELKQQCVDSHKLFTNVERNYLFAVGNHDIPIGSSNLYKYNLFTTRNVMYKDDTEHMNFYLDAEYNIRIIVVNAYSTADFSSWLSSVLDANKINVFCIHLSPLDNQNWANDTFTYASNVGDVLEGFVDNGGTLIQLFGHSHADFHFINPWLSISTGCAFFWQSNVDSADYRKITGYEGSIVAPARTRNTASEQLFDIVIIRPNARKINMVRFGAGSDREFDF